MTRGDVVGSTNAPDLLGLLSCTDEGEPRWAETICWKILGGLTRELDERSSATVLPTENATKRMQEQVTLDEPDDDPVTGIALQTPQKRK